ncbi:(+)-neomenthol dehydrogenase [Selaginella moellendorffii]|nr:(+)-neomenthol dehydrogenase [Selaginella moellendorffii]|eukprot:XP_002983044.2 (+)-neomenthol dehydrogenase [Selaginella moellendorffii]
MASQRWWSKDTVAVVTGGNKGIGFEIVRQLAKKGISVVLTARDEKRGLAAQAKLKSENLHVEFRELDVSSSDSVAGLASWLEKEYKGFDILVNNAAVVGNEFSFQAVKNLVDTNYDGVKRTTRVLSPLLRPSQAGARIVNISSQLGQLHRLGIESYKKKLTDIENLSSEVIDSFVDDYLSAVRDGKVEASGWPRGIFGAYTVSKIALNAYTRLVARDVQREGRQLYVNCVHPGYVKTDLNNNRGFLSTEQGADTAVWLALVPANEQSSGDFFYERKKYEF